MADVVAIALPPGERYVEEIRRAWDQGAAIAPLDPRLPPAAQREVISVLAPTVIVGPDAERSRSSGGRAAEVGDAVIIATSGTTGTPKAVVLTHQGVMASATATSSRLGVMQDSDKWLACLPLGHIGGLSVVMRAILTGTDVIVQPRFDPHSAYEAAAAGATLVSLVPTALARLTDVPFRKVVLGGMAPPDGLADNVVTTYGMTETASGVVYDGIPLDGVVLSIAENGEVLIKAPMVARTYRDGAPIVDSGGWLHTGDAGSLGRDGRLSVFGRMSETINTGGEKIWPSSVERRLNEHPKVRQAAVLGRPDPHWGQKVVALVVPKDESEPPSLQDLRQWTKETLAPWSAPKELVIVKDLPTTASGKIQRAKLPTVLS